MPILRLKLPNQSEVTHELTGDVITVGRRPDNTIQIIDRSISAHHAEFILEGGHYRLRDLDSTNFTFVEGTPVKDFHLHDPCEIVFGSVVCKFDTIGGGYQEPRLSNSQLERDLAFLRGENADLQGKIITLQRQIDILSSARLVTKKTENTPFAAANDHLRAIISERDDLRHMSTGLKLELENQRGELAATVRERDAARQACELLQASKATMESELHRLREQVESLVLSQPAATASSGEAHAPVSTSVTATATAPAKAHGEGRMDSTQRIQLPLSPALQTVETALKPVQIALHRLAPGNPVRHIGDPANRLVESTNKLGDHPVSRLAYSIQAMIQDLAGQAAPPTPGQVETLRRAGDLIAELLDSRKAERSRSLPHPKVLVAGPDSDLLQTVTATLELAQLPTQSCSASQEVQNLVANEDFDLLLLDATLPGPNGEPLGNHLRGNERYRTTPIILLAAEHPLEPQAQAKLSGNDFLVRPLNTAELAVKAETWIWKKRFDLL